MEGDVVFEDRKKSSFRLIDGTALAAVSRMIVVSFNYRLGALGALSLGHQRLARRRESSKAPGTGEGGRAEDDAPILVGHGQDGALVPSRIVPFRRSPADRLSSGLRPRRKEEEQTPDT